MTRFVRFIVENEHFTILLALIILFYGVTSVYQLNLVQEPEVNLPQIDVFFTLPGASPSELQRNVVFPVEAELRGVKDVVDIRTTVSHGRVQTWLKFKHGSDAVQKSREVEGKINNIRRKLPQRLDFTVQKATISDLLSAFVLAVYDNAGDRQVQHDIAFDLVNELVKIQHLKNVRVIRADEDVIVALDLARMRWLGVGVDQVIAAIESDNAFSASGRLRVGGDYVRFSGPGNRYRRFEDIRKTVVYSGAGNPVPLAEIARIYRQARGNTVISRFRGIDAAFVEIGVEASEVNILDVQDKIVAAVQAFQAGLPDGFHIEFVFDQSAGVRNLVFGLLVSFAQGLGIVFFVLLFAVGLRSTVIISSILPLSFFTALAVFSFTGYGIQQVSLAGFIIALGLIVDNGIVVNENAFLLQQYQGYQRSQAAITGTASAIGPLFSSTLTTVLAFAPLFILSSDAAMYLRSMSVSIWLSLFASLFVAVTFVTVLLDKIGTIGPLFRIPNPPSFLIKLIPFRDRAYQRMLFYAVKWRPLTILAFVFLLGYALFLGSTLKVQVFPITGEPFFTVNIDLQADRDEVSQQQLAREVEQKLQAFDAVTSTATLIGRNFPWLNPNMNNIGDIVILARTRFGDEQRITRLLAEVRAALRPLRVYAEIDVLPFQRRDLRYPSPFALVLSGSDVDALSQYARAIDETLRSVDGVDAVRNPMKSNQPALRLDFLDDRANVLGVAKHEVDLYTSMLTYGFEVDRFRDSRGREFPILLKIPAETDGPMGVLREVSVPSVHGESAVPLSAVVQPVLEESESHITHHRFQPTVTIDIWNEDGSGVEQVAAATLAAVQAIERPPGVAVAIGGALRLQQEDFQGLGKNALVIAALIFAIFVLQFKSFLQPLIIFSAVPLCIIGAVIGLVVAGQTMTFFTAVGVTSLMGIVVNDSILLVDAANKIRQEQPAMPVKDAAVEAGRKRFMPVLLTSVTTVAGLLPMALGASMFKSMAIAIIGGMISSTFLILLLVPVLYSYLSKGKS